MKYCVLSHLWHYYCAFLHTYKTFSKWNYKKYLICIIKESFLSFHFDVKKTILNLPTAIYWWLCPCTQLIWKKDNRGWNLKNLFIELSVNVLIWMTIEIYVKCKWVEIWTNDEATYQPPEESNNGRHMMDQISFPH